MVRGDSPPVSVVRTYISFLPYPDRRCDIGDVGLSSLQLTAGMGMVRMVGPA